MEIKYKDQKKVKDNEKVDYGIGIYTKDQDSLHGDIMKLLKTQRYQKISADDCMVVFGRVYSVFCLSRLKQMKRIKMTNMNGDECVCNVIPCECKHKVE